ILSWDQAIDVQQIYQLIKRRTEADASIELLVLSACETAKGDRRSALGIAGLATQAGARSTVASLWRVDATSTATFMAQFYQSLAQGKTKADALRTAQLSLLAQPDFHHPYFWAPFILIGSWL
ncbi:MAG: CHAT domain-containing protein, partial [Leptolyngbyaceae cyanobacterium bins.59]|nr:CHAT domain-containing protein [Leptolyngbyaceae cyanobacterium bins.59]